MWLFKNPPIISKNRRLFITAHYFELLGILGLILIAFFSLFFGLNILNNPKFLLYPLYLMYGGYMIALILLSYIAFFKKEALNVKIVVADPGLTLFLVDINTLKADKAYYKGRIFIIEIIVSSLVFWLYPLLL